LTVNAVQNGWKSLRLRVVGYDRADRVVVHADGAASDLPLESGSWRMSGGELLAAFSETVCI
jgi:hypothetical protein